jgi:hypothetical protein
MSLVSLFQNIVSCSKKLNVKQLKTFIIILKRNIMLLSYVIIGGIIGNLTSLIYCGINKVGFTRNTYGISHGNICIFIGTVSGCIINFIHGNLKN